MKVDSLWLINLIKENFINEDGVLSQDFPVSKKNLLSDLDDYLPFFFIFWREKFYKNQIIQSRKIYKNPALVQSHGSRIISYMNNEYVGGVANYYDYYKDSKIKIILDEIVESVLIYLSNDNTIITYYDIKNDKKSKIINPYFGAFIEVLIELEHLYPKLSDITYPTIDFFIKDSTFEKYGVFPSKIHQSSKVYNHLFRNLILPIPNKVLNILNVHFYSQGRWADYAFKLPIGPFSQLAKDNSNLVFALIEAYKLGQNPRYKNAIIKWISGFKKYFIRDNDIYRFLNRDCTVNEINTGHIHPIIDILCDTYSFVTKDYKFNEISNKNY